MVDLMMWLVIAALLLAAALQGIGYYQKAAYLNNMKQAAQVAGTNAFAVSAQDEGTISTAVLDTAATDTTWSQGMEYTVEESSVQGGSPYLRVTNSSVTDQDVIYLFESCGDTYAEGVNVVPKDGTPQLESCGVTPASEGAGGAGGPVAPASGTMTTVWDTSIVNEWQSTPCSIITIPLTGTVNATIDWGNGEVESVTTESIAANGLPKHTYTDTPGVKTITIDGSFTGWVGSGAWPDWSYECLTAVTEWEETGTTDVAYAFMYAKNLVEVDRIPSTATNYQYMFNWAESFNDNLSDWDTSNVTVMEGMFRDATAFNGDVSSWDVSNVTNFYGMFMSDVAFNQDLNQWVTSSATNMDNMFRDTTFNGNISGWNVSNVTSMYGMFAGSSFSGDLSRWDTSRVRDMELIFAWRDSAPSSIAGWNVSSVQTLQGAFWSTESIPDISQWNTSSATDMQVMFAEIDASITLPDIGKWNVSNVTNMNSMFRSSENITIPSLSGWNTAKVGNMGSMFYGVNDVPNVSGWNTVNLTHAEAMFSNAKGIDSNISGWNTAKLSNANFMFSNATGFNQNLSGWSTAGYPAGTYPMGFSNGSGLTKANHPLAWQSVVNSSGVYTK